MSFGNEVRDFLASYMAVSDMRERRAAGKADREYRDAMLELQRDRVDMERERMNKRGSGRSGDPLADARLKLRQEEFELRRAEFDRRKRESEETAKRERLEGLADSFGGAPARPAAPSDPSTDTPPEDGFDPDEYWTPDDPDLKLARGGLVPRPRYNQGGLVDEEDRGIPGARFQPVRQRIGPAPPPDNQGGLVDEEGRGIPGARFQRARQPNAAPRTALPTAPAPPPDAAAPPAVSAPARGPVPAYATPGTALPAPAPATEAAPDEAPEELMDAPTAKASRIVIARAAEAADAAIKSFPIDERRPSAIGGEEGAPDVDFVTNRGALSPSDYEKIRKMVDPEDKMLPHLQSGAILAEGFNFFKERGDLPRAEAFARQILLTQKSMSQTAGALTLRAIEDGNLPAACRLLNDACNRFPSGHLIEVKPDDRRGLIYKVSNNGENVETGRLNVEQFWELATGVANGSTFLSEVATFASETRARPPTPEGALSAAIDARLDAESAIEALNEAVASGVTGAPLRELKSSAEATSKAFKDARARAIEVGNKRTDVDQAFTQALRVRVPAVPESALGDPKGNWLTRTWAGSPDYTESDPPAAPPTGAPPAGASAIPAAPPSATPATPSVTPPGNLRPPSPDVMQRARAAIAAGAPAEQVKQRLREAGFSTEGF